MHKTVFLSRARKDLRDTATWYDEQQPGLGRRFTHAIRNKLVLISENPYLYAVRYKKTRTALVWRFPFMIHFRIDERQKIAVVIGIWHTSQDPLKIQARKQ
ncbi:type II toxin-antitoxin system RelE/ParE family toxin [Dyadobacter fermentans]|uniref:Plasmid stabilization system n=1 Tax=Dyadobacter fermentans (strain ATCC 700827 / DSM 18053 / CIP 107007 / KCTC 52180 / NS114) TaxID=471854 RepID=C6VSY8_DYAFD|nr:plasmid stabilization system [Dyadobacter fermentans DSM 18053]